MNGYDAIWIRRWFPTWYKYTGHQWRAICEASLAWRAPMSYWVRLRELNNDPEFRRQFPWATCTDDLLASAR